MENHIVAHPIVASNPSPMTRIIVMLMLTIASTACYGQKLVGKYHDHFGHRLELKKDSTFRFDWSFDLAQTWSAGQWTVSGKILNLAFIDVYDTLSRAGKPDSLVLSLDEHSTKIDQVEFALSLITSGQQDKGRFSDKFYIRNKRLFIVNKNGRPSRSRYSPVWRHRKWPWGYKKWPTFFVKEH
jgi:hypothetical protein